MEDINKEDIINEDNEIYDFSLIKKISNSEIEKCVCKIEIEAKIGDKYVYKTGTGFFCNIAAKNIKVFLTNNNVLNQEFLDNSKKINYSVEINNLKINNYIDLEKKRFKYTDKEIDFTVIEILKEDNISDFLEVDDFINSKDYKDE